MEIIIYLLLVIVAVLLLYAIIFIIHKSVTSKKYRKFKRRRHNRIKELTNIKIVNKQNVFIPYKNINSYRTAIHDHDTYGSDDYLLLPSKIIAKLLSLSAERNEYGVNSENVVLHGRRGWMQKLLGNSSYIEEFGSMYSLIKFLHNRLWPIANRKYKHGIYGVFQEENCIKIHIDVSSMDEFVNMLPCLATDIACKNYNFNDDGKDQMIVKLWLLLMGSEYTVEFEVYCLGMSSEFSENILYNLDRVLSQILIFDADNFVYDSLRKFTCSSFLDIELEKVLVTPKRPKSSKKVSKKNKSSEKKGSKGKKKLFTKGMKNVLKNS